MITSDEQLVKAIKDNLIWCCGRGVRENDKQNHGSAGQFNLMIAEKEGNGNYTTYLLDFNGIGPRAFKIVGKKPALFNTYPAYNKIRAILQKDLEFDMDGKGVGGYHYAPKKDAEYLIERFPEKELDFFKNSEFLKKIVKRYIDHSNASDKEFTYERAMKNLKEMSTFANDCLYFRNNSNIVDQEVYDDWIKNEAPNYIGAKREKTFLHNLASAYREIENKQRQAAYARTSKHRYR